MMTNSESSLVRAVLVHGPISRASLTRRLGLSPASLTRLAKPFIDRGLVVELDEHHDGTVGRPTRPLDIAPDLGEYAGVKITGDEVHAVLTDVRATALRSISLPLHGHSPDAVADVVTEAVDAVGGRPSDIGVSIGGAVRYGVVEQSGFLDWRDVPFAELVRSRTGLPCVLENDLIALAEAEHWFGVGRGLSGFSVITIGAGIGHALVANDTVVRTREAGLGASAHVLLDPTGPVCSLGHRGCAEAMLTLGSIAAQVSIAKQRPVDFDGVLRLAGEGDPAATAVLGAAADALGRLIATTANLTLQSTVVLAGEGVAMVPLVEERLRAAIVENRHPLADPVDLHVDASGFGAWARGAAAVAIQASIERLEA